MNYCCARYIFLLYSTYSIFIDIYTCLELPQPKIMFLAKEKIAGVLLPTNRQALIAFLEVLLLKNEQKCIRWDVRNLLWLKLSKNDIVDIFTCSNFMLVQIIFPN